MAALTTPTAGQRLRAHHLVTKYKIRNGQVLRAIRAENPTTSENGDLWTGYPIDIPKSFQSNQARTAICGGTSEITPQTIKGKNRKKPRPRSAGGLAGMRSDVTFLDDPSFDHLIRPQEE
jgi:hypothetical protein